MSTPPECCRNGSNDFVLDLGSTLLPEGANAENTVCVGICAKKLADEMGFRWVVGCPPGNADVVKGVLGDRKEYGVRYS